MSMTPEVAVAPEHNVTGIDYSDRRHFRYAGPPPIDFHAHVLQTRPTDPKNGPPAGTGPGASVEQAEIMLDVAQEFGISRIYSMCYPDDITLSASDSARDSGSTAPS